MNSATDLLRVVLKREVLSAKLPGRGRARARFALVLGRLGQNRPSSVNPFLFLFPIEL